jgi:hypothetical protein
MMAGNVVLAIVFGLLVAAAAVTMGAGYGGGLAAYAGGGALWLTRGLLPRSRRR